MFPLKSQLLPSLTSSAIEVLTQISEFFAMKKKYEEKLSCEEEKDKLFHLLSSFSRSVSWFVGKTAYKLVKIKEEEKDPEKKEKESPTEKMIDMILHSKLLSGGIDTRQVCLFS